MAVYEGKIVSYLDEKKEFIKIKFPFDYKTIGEIKANIIYRKWDNASKHWYAPATITNLQNLKKLGFRITIELEELLKNEEKQDFTKNLDIKDALKVFKDRKSVV